MDVWDYFRGHQDQVLDWTWTTVWLAAIPLAIGLLVALPLGYLAHRKRWTYVPMISVTGLLYTVPSLVLLIVLPGVLGTRILDTTNVLVALSVYTVALLVRVVADGLGSVAEDTMAAASAMGLSERQRLLKVQLPVAVPVIGAGLRVAAVSNVSLVSVASIIGIPQLGSLFTIGAQQSTMTPVLLGMILVIMLGLAFDGVILLGVRLLTPWRRA